MHATTIPIAAGRAAFLLLYIHCTSTGPALLQVTAYTWSLHWHAPLTPLLAPPFCLYVSPVCLLPCITYSATIYCLPSLPTSLPTMLQVGGLTLLCGGTCQVLLPTAVYMPVSCLCCFLLPTETWYGGTLYLLTSLTWGAFWDWSLPVACRCLGGISPHVRNMDVECACLPSTTAACLGRYSSIPYHASDPPSCWGGLCLSQLYHPITIPHHVEVGTPAARQWGRSVMPTTTYDDCVCGCVKLTVPSILLLPTTYLTVHCVMPYL